MISPPPSALPRVLITRARRDSKSPTVASRLWLRLMAMTGGLARDLPLERMVAAIDDPGEPQPVGRPAPSPPAAERPRKISVTQVDRMKADPFAFYASAMLGLNRLDPVDADHSAAWKGSAVHEVLEDWLRETDCDPDDLVDRAKSVGRGRCDPPHAARPVAAAADRGDRVDCRTGARQSRRWPRPARRRGQRRDDPRRGHAPRPRRPDRPAARRAAWRSSTTRPASRPSPRRSMPASRCNSACSG